MALTKFNKNVNNNQSQPDQPTLTAEQMKKLLDQAGIDIKQYLNEVLTEEIDTLLNGKAPNNHASSGTTYGVGTESKYGHNKVINNLTKSSFVNGESLSAYQGKVLKGLIDGKANTSHTHTKSQITDFPNALKNPNALTIKFNGTTNKTYDGGSAQAVDVTAVGIGASPKKHNSEGEDYGLGSINYYGHVKTVNNLNTSSYTPGLALHAYQGYLLNSVVSLHTEQINNIMNMLQRVENTLGNLDARVTNLERK